MLGAGDSDGYETGADKEIELCPNLGKKFSHFFYRDGDDVTGFVKFA